MADFNEIAHKLAEQLSEMAERFGDVSEAARRTGARIAGGRTQWVILPVAGAALYAAAKNAPAIGRSVRQARERTPAVPDTDVLGLLKELTGFGDDGREEREGRPAGRGSSDPAGLKEHLRSRAERRRRRRQSMGPR